jgi:hypothetical protein
MRLALINQVLTSAGFAPIVKADESAPLTIDNLTTAAAVRPGPPGPGPKVTVIMPAHNAAATIRMAVSGLLGQTWRNLEIIVVDDNSTDGTAEIAQELAASDPRVVAIRHDRNRGAFAARNSGLMHASGELITVHDCDDWSHPQKIETQVQLMIANPTLVGTRTYWARVSQGMHFFSWWRPGQSIIALNYSSFMFNRELLAALGGWDRVRVAGDSEFIFRAQSIFSKERLANLMPAAPLSFSRGEADSLTRHSDTHIQTSLYGVRRDYRDAYKWWHENATSRAQLRLDSEAEVRRFPAPRRVQLGSADLEFDAVFFLDVKAAVAAQAPVLNWIRDTAAAGRVAIFNWPQYSTDVGKEPALGIWGLVVGSGITLLSAGDQAITDRTIVYDPEILKYAVDNPPDLTTTSLFLVTRNDRASPSDAGEASSIEFTGRLLDTFGKQGEWISGPEIESHLKAVLKPKSPITKGVASARLDFGEGTLIFDMDSLRSQRTAWRNDDTCATQLVRRLLQGAEAALTRERLSVVDKTTLPPSGDRQDYFSRAPYWWPNPHTPSGLPSVRRDGVRVPGTVLYDEESHNYDRSRAQRLFDDVTVLALASFFTGSDRYAEHAVTLLRTWFVDPATRMYPHLKYAQARPGHGDGGSPEGIIEFKDIYYLLDAVTMLKSMDAMDRATGDATSDWFARYLHWLRDSPQGRSQARAANNRGVWFELQTLAIAWFLRDADLVSLALARARGRIGEHFEPDGGQIHEVRRTLAKHYCAFNLQAWANLALAAEAVNVDLWNFRHANGAGLATAFQWFLNYRNREWPYQQIEPFDELRFSPLLAAYDRGCGRSSEAASSQDLFDDEWLEPSSNYGVRPYWRLG